MNVNKPTILLVILIVAIPCLSWANKDLVDPIDKRLEECIDKTKVQRYLNYEMHYHEN